MPTMTVIGGIRLRGERKIIFKQLPSSAPTLTLTQTGAVLALFPTSPTTPPHPTPPHRKSSKAAVIQALLFLNISHSAS